MSKDWDGIEWVDGQKVHRDSTGRVTHLGTEPVNYDTTGRPGTVGGKPVTYMPDGKPQKIGNSIAFPLSDSNYVTTGSDFHPGAGTVLSGENAKSKPKRRPPAGGSDVAEPQRMENFQKDTTVVWAWAAALLLPSYVLAILLNHGPLFFLQSDVDFRGPFITLAVMFTIAAAVTTAALFVMEYATPAEPDGTSWKVPRLLDTTSNSDMGASFPALCLFALIPAWMASYAIVMVTGRWTADINLWYFLPAIIIPGITYLYLKQRYLWLKRDVYHRYFGAVIVSNNNVVHHTAVQDGNGNATKEPSDGIAVSLGVYAVCIFLGIVAQSFPT